VNSKQQVEKDMTEKDVKRVPWFLWPFVAVWELLAAVLNVTGRLLAVVLGVTLMVVGIVLIVTIVGAPLGIPFVILGLLLMIRSIF
jgi:multidrug efflux pump subunit AcrB